MTSTQEIIDHIIDIEGGFVDDPDDSGGETNFGTTADELMKLSSSIALEVVGGAAVYFKFYVESGPGKQGSLGGQRERA